MRKARTALAVTVAVVAALVMTAPASAYELEISEPGAIEMASLGELTWEGGWTMGCSYTLNGILDEGPVPIAADARIGQITEVQINQESCDGGRVRTALVGEGWDVTIDSVPSGLPNEMESVQLVIQGFAWQLATIGAFLTCLWMGDVPASLAVNRTRTAGVYTTELLTILENNLGLVEGSGCPSEGSFNGSFGLTPRQTLTIT